MALFCGIDIIEVYRIRKALEKSNESFKNRVFTENEILYCESKNASNIKAMQHVLQQRKQCLKPWAPVLGKESAGRILRLLMIVIINHIQC